MKKVNDYTQSMNWKSQFSSLLALKASSEGSNPVSFALKVITLVLVFLLVSNTCFALNKKKSLDEKISEMEKALNWLPKDKNFIKNGIYQSQKNASITPENEIVAKNASITPENEIVALKGEVFRPVKLHSSYKGYDVFKWKDVYYGINVGDRDLAIVIISSDMRSIESPASFPWTKSDSEEGVIVEIDALVSKSWNKEDLPLLEESNYFYHNIVFYNGTFYGINLAEGPIDVRHMEKDARFPWISGSSLVEAKDKITQLIEAGDTPYLVSRNYKNYDIYRYKNLFLGVSYKEGPVDVTQIEKEGKYVWFKDSSQGVVEAGIDGEFEKSPLKRRVRWYLSKVRDWLRNLIR